MSRPIIEVDRISKRYKLGQFSAQSLREEAEQFFGRFRRARRGDDDPKDTDNAEFWALRDVSFSVEPGEVVGIIGRNGAGKSTLLKILSRVTEPTSGEARLRGRVASLLEVGTGFHPELTGRENIYLNGTILGMTKAEVRAKFDEIVAFAEIGRFLETPVKRYSSGMYVRLAFAVAAHLEPEILIVDEVLSVGDADFQNKCLGKMQSVSLEGGRTVLFVSHNMTAVASLCSRAILLEGGGIKKIGTVKEVVDHYLAPETGQDDTREQSWLDVHSAPGDERVRIHRTRILSDKDDPQSPIDMETPFRIVIEYWNLIDDANLIVELVVRARDGTPVFQSMSTEDPRWGPPQAHGLLRSTCLVPANLLNAGTFRVEIYFLHGRTSDYFTLTDVPTFSVHDVKPRDDLTYYGHFVGNVHPRLHWDTGPVSSEPNSGQGAGSPLTLGGVVR